MMDDTGSDQSTTSGAAAGLAAQDSLSTRRSLLRLGAIGATAIVTIRPALAQSAASVMNCEIPIPDAARRGQYVAADGTLVRPGTAGAFAPPGRPLKGEDVKQALHGRTLPGADPEASRAYTNYIRRLQHGQSGFTCYASLQMPGR
ncbi:hypothetical protein [Sphingomonas sp.]|uniref:hypothetical protein n=1 Tax=Sphingomonas sp. TaxID=28214 RepID=UPI0025F26418|nr:hypothetical protein [Sphingomonas sp.]